MSKQTLDRGLWPFIGLLGIGILLILAGGIAATEELAAQEGGVFPAATSSILRIGQGNADVTAISLSRDGLLLAFATAAEGLVTGDDNQASDIFVYNGQTGQVNLVSVNGSGKPANGASVTPALAGEGRYLAFASQASDLVLGDSNQRWDIFVRDLVSGETSRVSVASDGSQANGDSFNPAISGDGRYVVFESDATNLVADDTNSRRDIFLHDRSDGSTVRISAADSQGGDGDSSLPAISDDGQWVVFESAATNLVDQDTNQVTDIFAWQRGAGTLLRLSLDPSSQEQGNGPSSLAVIAGGGRYVAFRSFADNLVPDDSNATWDIFVYDLQTNTMELATLSQEGDQVSPALLFPDAPLTRPAISGDGRFVAFQSDAANLVADDTNGQMDIFVRDLAARTTRRASLAWSGSQANGHSFFPQLSEDGGTLAFLSQASNLVAGDVNGFTDGFLYGDGSAYPTPTFTPTATPSPTPTVTPTPTPGFQISLPLVMRYRPLVTPALSPIDNSDRDNGYTLQWQVAGGADPGDRFLLEEATAPDFSDARLVYQGPQRTWVAQGKTPGRYFYRVRLQNGSRQTEWSAPQAVTIAPLFVGMSVRWEGTEDRRGGDQAVDIGLFWTESLSARSGPDGILSQGSQWYQPNPFEWPSEQWTSAYHIDTGEFISTTLPLDPAVRWGNPWILPYDLDLQGVSAVSVSGQIFDVSGPFLGTTGGGHLVRYWRLVNRHSFTVWDDGGALTQVVQPGDIELRYDAGATGLLLRLDVLKRNVQDGIPTGETIHQVLDLVETNALER